MNPIFKNPDLQNQFDSEGYVVVDVLNNEQVGILKDIYNKQFKNVNFHNFFSSNLLSNIDLRYSIAYEIFEIIEKPLKELLQNVYFWKPAFLIKPSNINSEFELHQDWTFVDEDKFYSGNIWVPLQDTDFNNGTINVIPKTHFKCVKTYRSRNQKEIFEFHRNELKEFCVNIPLRPGQAIVFQHSLIHYSPPNNSPFNRISVSCGFNSEEATLISLNKVSENKFLIHKMNENFVFDYEKIEDIGIIPIDAPIIGELEIEFKKKIHEIKKYFGLI